MIIKKKCSQKFPDYRIKNWYQISSQLSKNILLPYKTDIQVKQLGSSDKQTGGQTIVKLYVPKTNF